MPRSMVYVVVIVVVVVVVRRHSCCCYLVSDENVDNTNGRMKRYHLRLSRLRDGVGFRTKEVTRYVIRFHS